MVYGAIEWTVDPIGFRLGALNINYYGLFFVACIVSGVLLMRPMFRRRGLPLDGASGLTIYVVLGILICARLVHCLAYDTARTLADPLSLLRFWDGGLASHGAVIGTFAGSYVWCRRGLDRFAAALAPRTPKPLRALAQLVFGPLDTEQKLSWMQTLDIIVPAIATSIIFIRLGNLFNHEIVGRVTVAPWAFRFRYHSDQLPRHPAQLYEATLGLFVLGVLTYFAYWRERLHRDGFRLWLFLTLLFGVRFFLEFFKEYQSDALEALPGLTLTMGQLLSLPVLAISIPLGLRAWPRPEGGEE